MQRMMVMVLATMLLLPFAGCLEQDEATNEVGTFSLNVEWTTIPLESKSGYYEDEQSISWDVTSDLVSDQIEDSGGIVVGVLMSLDYPNEDESPNPGFCTGFENNVPDTVSGTVSKNEWALTESGSNPGSHDVNLTWHNQSLLEMESISGMSKSEILQQIDFRDDALGSYSLTILVDAEAYDGATCSHTDNGEDVTSSVSLLVVDVQLDGGDDASTLSVGEGAISILLFSRLSAHFLQRRRRQTNSRIPSTSS